MSEPGRKLFIRQGNHRGLSRAIVLPIYLDIFRRSEVLLRRPGFGSTLRKGKGQMSKYVTYVMAKHAKRILEGDAVCVPDDAEEMNRSEEHTSELQSRFGI